MKYALIEDGVVIQIQPNPQDKFIEVADSIHCGLLFDGKAFTAPIRVIDPQIAINATEKAAKLTGIEFNGVMCSATKEDQWGLASIKSYVVDGQSINFEFENGTSLLLTPDNIEYFEALWFPFRLGFFKG